jgi:hypothetical protein
MIRIALGLAVTAVAVGAAIAWQGASDRGLPRQATQVVPLYGQAPSWSPTPGREVPKPADIRTPQMKRDLADREQAVLAAGRLMWSSPCSEARRQAFIDAVHNLLALEADIHSLTVRKHGIEGAFDTTTHTGLGMGSRDFDRLPSARAMIDATLDDRQIARGEVAKGVAKVARQVDGFAHTPPFGVGRPAGAGIGNESAFCAMRTAERRSPPSAR